MEISGLSVVILDNSESVVIRAMVELASLAERRPDALVSLAAGETFVPFLNALAEADRAGRIDLSAMRFTHHDEFFEFEPTDQGGLAHELLACETIGRAHGEGRFLVIPSGGAEGVLHQHEQHVAAIGRVQLQFLGIGSNGNIACCESGTPFDSGYHRVPLAAVTREHIASRFRTGAAIPSEAITAGPRSLLAAERIVLMATGVSKAAAVRDMMDGGVESACPASLLRRHPDVLLLLDSAAATELDWPGV